MGYAATRDDGVDSGANWISKTCKAPVTSPPSTHQHLVFTSQMPFLPPPPINSVKVLKAKPFPNSNDTN